MNKVKINMVGGGFMHDICSSAGSIPKYMEWDKTLSSDISIHIDYGILQQPNKNKKNYAWIYESSTINTNLILWLRNNSPYLEENFDLIFTHDISLLPLSKKVIFIKPTPQSWIKDIKIYDKSKLVSMIASLKQYCNEHIYRNTIIEKYLNVIDCFGMGHNPITSKEIGLCDYYFSITIENGTYNYMFSEKIVDCFATGTIPIYWGTELIGNTFNENGIIKYTDDFDINTITPELYLSKYDAIIENMNIVKNFPIAEDFLYLNFIK